VCGLYSFLYAYIVNLIIMLLSITQKKIILSFLTSVLLTRTPANNALRPGLYFLPHPIHKNMINYIDRRKLDEQPLKPALALTKNFSARTLFIQNIGARERFRNLILNFTNINKKIVCLFRQLFQIIKNYLNLQNFVRQKQNLHN
jgi:hypothetical protein